MTRAQYEKFLEVVRISRLRFANDPATLAKLDEVERDAHRMMEAK
jgi:hypothetical protein